VQPTSTAPTGGTSGCPSSSSSRPPGLRRGWRATRFSSSTPAARHGCRGTSSTLRAIRICLPPQPRRWSCGSPTCHLHRAWRAAQAELNQRERRREEARAAKYRPAPTF
jgi:hypothetical protein